MFGTDLSPSGVAEEPGLQRSYIKKNVIKICYTENLNDQIHSSLTQSLNIDIGSFYKTFLMQLVIESPSEAENKCNWKQNPDLLRMVCKMFKLFFPVLYLITKIQFCISHAPLSGGKVQMRTFSQ